MVTYEKPVTPEPPRKRGLNEMLGLSGTEKKIAIGCLAIVVVLLLVVTAGALASGESSRQVKIVVTTTGSWYGAYGVDGNKRGLNEMLGLSGTEKKIAIGCLAIVVVLLLVVTAGALASGESSRQVKIVVTTTGSWYGAYGVDGNMTTWSGSGNTTTVYTRDAYESTVRAYVYSYSGQEVTLQIVSMSGKVLAETTSTGSYIQVQWSP